MTILVVGAHMDDAEYGIGGIIINAAAAGHRVVVIVAVSDYSTWAATIGREHNCHAQQLAIAKRFGYEKRFLGYPYHQFHADLEAKKKIAEIYVEIQPDIAFIQNTNDHWPDHVHSGTAAKDAVLFSHGLTRSRAIRRCPRIFAYNVCAYQTVKFQPDFFVDVTDVMPQYMDLLCNTDSCLTGKSPEQLLYRQITDLETGASVKVSHTGWQRLTQCAQWGYGIEPDADANPVLPYAIGLETLWGPRDGRPLWDRKFARQ